VSADARDTALGEVEDLERKVGQHPATPRQIHRAILRPLLTCGSLIDKFCLTPQTPLFNIGRF
jgi:hypothetical protein